ncbi:hypothetical protein GLOIN_2v1781787 [Rhizophagus clarus]|nr:hypothetical protein GLOIN_2v1781787 [Rhizophagus clarus]
MSLFKLFIENESKLHFLDVEVTKHFRYNSYLDDILELMLQNPNFVHNIKNLELRIVVPPSYNEDIKSRSIKNRISQVINSYQILRKIVLGYDSFSFYNSLLLSNNCSNTLSTIIFYHINFEGIINLDKIFEQLNVLKSVHIIYCSSLNTEFIQQIINLTKPFKLKSLFINGISQIESLKLLLQKSGDYLENFGYGFKNNYDLSLGQQLLESVLEYCENIKFFDFYESKDQLIFSELNLIENIKQNLNYLSIDVCNTLFSMDAINRSSIILQNLGQILPIKLEYLCLTLNINIDDFELFLKNSQDTFIKKLLIDNRGGHNILFCVKENIMKRERVNYLAIVDVFFDKYNDTFFEEKDLFLLKDEVKEFESYNIKIQEYNDLIIRPTSKNFAKELD